MFFTAIFSHSSHHKFAENDNAKINFVIFFCNTPHMYRGQPTCWRAKGSKKYNSGNVAISNEVRERCNALALFVAKSYALMS